jgi:hypothetical protein
VFVRNDFYMLYVVFTASAFDLQKLYFMGVFSPYALPIPKAELFSNIFICLCPPLGRAIPCDNVSLSLILLFCTADTPLSFLWTPYLFTPFFFPPTPPAFFMSASYNTPALLLSLQHSLLTLFFFLIPKEKNFLSFF